MSSMEEVIVLDGDSNEARSDTINAASQPAEASLNNFFSKRTKVAGTQNDKDEEEETPTKAKEQETSFKWVCKIPEFKSSPVHREYVSKIKRQDERRMFDVIEIVGKAESGSNGNKKWCCHACGHGVENPKTSSITKIKAHIMEKCPCSSIDEPYREAFKKQLRGQAEQFKRGNDKDMLTAKKLRAINPSVDTFFKDRQAKVEYVSRRAARFFLGCNLPPNLGQNTTFRQFVYEIGKMDPKDFDEGLLEDCFCRAKLDTQMTNEADRLMSKAEKKWKEDALVNGGSFSVDGWSSRLVQGMIGIVFLSFVSVFYPALIPSGARSRAQDYMDKVVPRLPIDVMWFMCVDGASNMVSFGEKMLVEHKVTPILCCAHGYSLMSHAIAKALDQSMNLFKRVSGIVAYFSRSPPRMMFLKKHTITEGAPKGLGFVKISATRFCYMTAVVLRMLRIRLGAQKALLDSGEPTTEHENIDPLSKYAQVKASLEDNAFFKDLEIFVRLTLPIILMMRMMDAGTPVIGFVYWGFHCVETQIANIMDEFGEQSQLEALRRRVLDALRCLWNKRHSPAFSLAYLTNPLFQPDLQKQEQHQFAADPSFMGDTKAVLKTMIKKSKPEFNEEQVATKLRLLMGELDKFLRNRMDDDAVEDSRIMSAAVWWNSYHAHSYGELSSYLCRLHSAPVVSSKMERFFSQMTNVQTENRASLDPEKASKFTSAHNILLSREHEIDTSEVQRELVHFVETMQTLMDSGKISKNREGIQKLEGIEEVENWLNEQVDKGISVLHPKKDDAPAAPPNLSDSEQQLIATDAAEPSQVLTEYEQILALEENPLSRESRNRHPPARFVVN